MKVMRRKASAELKINGRFRAVLCIAFLYLSKEISCNVLSGYFIKLQEIGSNNPKTRDGTSESTSCAHQCLSKASCRYVASQPGIGSCVILQSRPPAGVFDEVYMRTGYHVDCADAKRLGVVRSTILPILPSERHEPITVYCDMKTSAEGWIVIQRRLNGKVTFQRGWDDYQKGFGNLNEDFWLGLENLHILTTSKAMQLRVDIRNQLNQTGYAEYSTFQVASSLDFYRLTVSGYTGNVGDALADSTAPTRMSNGQQFSTYDKDNDGSSTGSCAAFKTGGWWFNQCYSCHPNGLFGEVHGDDRYISWIPWNSNVGDVAFIEMKIRPL